MKNHTLRRIRRLTSNYLVLSVLLSCVVLTGCFDGYYEQPDNKLKASPCACAGVIYDSRVQS